jgi:hypothetical protein
MVPNKLGAGANLTFIFTDSNKIARFRDIHIRNAQAFSFYPRCAAQNSRYFVTDIFTVYVFRWNTPITKYRSRVETRNSYRCVG